MNKTKTKRRAQHNAKYYLRKMLEAQELAVVDMLLFEAALQPRKVLPDTEYEKIYWLAQAKLQAAT